MFRGWEVYLLLIELRIILLADERSIEWMHLGPGIWVSITEHIMMFCSFRLKSAHCPDLRQTLKTSCRHTPERVGSSIRGLFFKSSTM